MIKNSQESQEVIHSVLQEVAKIASNLSGIQLGPKQMPMVESRLKSRMLKLGVSSFTNYLDHLKSDLDNESQALLSLLTTHHTYFFREFTQFEYMLNNCLPVLIEAARKRPDKTIRIWSAACSRGQEVYSLAMFFDFHLKAAAPDLQFIIDGTDVDPESVKYAKNGVYRNEELKKSPAMYLQQHWIQGKDNVKDFSKAKDSLKKHCHFATANLLKLDSFLQNKNYDLILCRNVFIYFDQDQIRQCTKSFLNHLQPHGFLLLGVSESLSGTGLSLETIGPSVYTHQRAVQAKSSRTSGVAAPAAASIPRIVEKAKPKVLSVLSIDDSTTILALMKKILVRDQGFELKATAANGEIAIELLKKQTFDMITLDLHMPIVDGLTFLEKTKDMPNRPPIVIVSSVNREDVSMAQKALALGAKDYVEKPSLENIVQGGDEIRSKLRSVYNITHMSSSSSAESSTAPSSAPAPVVNKFANKKIKVMIIDDSKTIRDLLKKVISQDSQLECVAEAEKPSQVKDLIEKHKPDVLTLDINLPEKDGVTLLKEIFPRYKIPTIMISSISREEGPQVLNALENGAFDYIQKPQAQDLSWVASQIRERIKEAAQSNAQNIKSVQVKKAGKYIAPETGALVVIGASTGGTEALKYMLSGMPSEIPPILVVQHIPAHFSAAFAERLNSLLPFEVREAKDGDEVKKNLVLIAPGGTQMAVVPANGKLMIKITDDAPVNRHKPSVDYMFASVNRLGLKNLTAVIMTGMGADGARELKNLRNAGAHTIAQDQNSCVVYGMPRAAVEIGAAEVVKPLGDIADSIMKFVNSVPKTEKKAS